MSADVRVERAGALREAADAFALQFHRQFDGNAVARILNQRAEIEEQFEPAQVVENELDRGDTDDESSDDQ